jgi:hypothetical protein
MKKLGESSQLFQDYVYQFENIFLVNDKVVIGRACLKQDINAPIGNQTEAKAQEDSSILSYETCDFDGEKRFV